MWPKIWSAWTERVAELIAEFIERVVLACVPNNVDATHVAVNLVRLVAVAKLDPVDLAVRVDGVAIVSGRLFL